MFWNQPDEFLQDGEDGIWVTVRGAVRSMYFSWPTFLCQTKYHTKEPRRLMLDYCHDMMAYRFFQPDPKKVLIIGLGGGVLHRNFYEAYPECDITSVEINPHVLEVAVSFFDVVLDDRSHCSVMGGDQFVAETDQKFDIIMIDATGSGNIPIRELSTIEFYANCRKCLNDGGMLLANLLHQKEAARKILETAFPRTYGILIGSSMWSMVLLAFTAPQEHSTVALKEKSLELNKLHGKAEGMDYRSLLRRALLEMKSTNRITNI